MGCDIHLFTEQKKKDGKWKIADHYVRNENHPDANESLDMKGWHRLDVASERNYTLFGILAGVRRPHPLEFVPKGFPEDASDEVKSEYEYWGVDAHSTSWLTVKEMEEKCWEADSFQLSVLLDKLETHFKSRWQHIKYDDEYKENCRIVFWFDN